MSFRCEACKVAQPDGTRPVTKQIAYRDRIYNAPSGDIPGREIVEEWKICPLCAGEPPTTHPLNAIPAN